MTMGTDDDLADAFDDPRLAPLVAELEAVAASPAPAIGDELAAVLAGAVPMTPVRRRHRAASLAVVGLLAGGTLAGGVGAAAADELPPPLQRVVARVVNTLTPFEIPHPDRTPTRQDPTPKTPVQPSPVVPDDDPDDRTEGSPGVDPSTSPEPGDDAAEGRGRDEEEERERDRSDDADSTAVDSDETPDADEGTDAHDGDGDRATSEDEGERYETDGADDDGGRESDDGHDDGSDSGED